MTDLEPLLRHHFSAEADAVPIDTNVLAGVDGLRQTRRHRRLVGGGSVLAVAVLAAAVAVPLTVVSHDGSDNAVTVSPNQPAVPATPPPGERAVTWAGIQFYVPASWPSVSGGSQRCSYDVERGGEVDYRSDRLDPLMACLSIERRVRERIELGTANALQPSYGSSPAAGPQSPKTTSSPGRLAGRAAIFTRAEVRGQLVTSVRVPSLGAVFTLTTNTQARSDAILASAHQVLVDEHGCTIDQPADLKPVAGGGVGGPQVVGTPTSGLVCSYSGGRLVMGAALDAKNLAALIADLNRMPARYTAAELAAQHALPLPAQAGIASLVLSDEAGHSQQITLRSPGPGGSAGVAGATQSTMTLRLFFAVGAVLPSGFGGGGLSTGLLPNG